MQANYYDRILVELKDTCSKFDNDSIDRLCVAILAAKRVFLAGTGRSGLMVKAFAMRLMHLGLNAFVVGETTTPGISQGDLLIIGSGSGETGSISVFAREAKEQAARLGLITIFPDSTIGKLADFTIQVRAPTRKNVQDNGITSMQPLGSLFEQSLLLLLDGMIMNLMERMNADPEVMFARHANLE